MAKRTVSFLIAICILMGCLLAGCSGGEPAADPTEQKQTAPTTQVTEPEIEPTEDPFMNAYHKQDPASDDTLYILTAAASNSHYFVDELYGVLAAAGIKAKACNLMRSSTGINLFYQYWKEEKNEFQLIIHDENGKTVMEGMNLDSALQVYNWDVFNMQEGTAPHRTMTALQAADERKLAHTELIAHIRQTMPMTKLYYQEIWSYDIGFDRFNYKMLDREQQLKFTQSIRDYTNIVCKDLDLMTIPCGDAWDIAREKSPLAYNMCARLSVNNGEGDYYHDGDIGGGQLLNAYVWFETLTGESCIGNTFRPEYKHNGITYTLDEELIKVLQESAHEAVEQMRAGA